MEQLAIMHYQVVQNPASLTLLEEEAELEVQLLKVTCRRGKLSR